MHASRSIDDAWQGLKPGDRVDDYGFSADDYFIVEEVQPDKALVFKSERYGAYFSWSLILHPQANDQTLLHLRFRGRIAATGFKKRLLVRGGEWMDRITTKPVRLIYHHGTLFSKSTLEPAVTTYTDHRRLDAVWLGRAR